MATHASALKAHRQNLVHRDRNRKYRTQLRTTLKQIRAFIDDPKNAAKGKDAKKHLSQAVSLIDRMAGKGIIHKNAAARYKGRLTKRIGRASAAA